MSQTKKHEILFVWNYVEWGGVQIYLLGIMRLALAQGYRVKVLLPAGSSEKLLGYLTKESIPFEFFNARITVLPPNASLWRKILRRYTDARCGVIMGRKLAKQDLSNKIVQIDDASVWSNFWLKLYLSAKTHVFMTWHIAFPHNPHSWRQKILKLKYHLLARRSRYHLLASNEDMKKSLRPFLPENFWQRIPIAYTGVNTAEMRGALQENLQRRLLTKYQLPDEKLLVVSLANIIERKGFRVWLEAARLLTKSRRDLHFVWIGDGERRAEMLDLIKQANLDEFITVINPSVFGGERRELLQLLRLADIFVHPSFAEGLPGAMLEAMALGKPVVVSNVNAIPECVIDGENGFLIEAGNADGFAAAIAKLADNQTLRESFGSRAQQQVLTNFTEERCAEITLDYYEKCLSVDKQVGKFNEAIGSYADEKIS